MSLYDGRPDKRKDLMGWPKKDNEGNVSLQQRNFNSRLIEIGSARIEGSYAKAYDLADNLLKDIDQNKENERTHRDPERSLQSVLC